MRIPVPIAASAITTSSPISATPTLQRPEPSHRDAEQAFATTSICATIRPGRIANSGITRSGCRTLADRERDTRTHEISRDGRGARSAPIAGTVAATRSQPHRLAGGGLIDRGRSRCRFTFRRRVAMSGYRRRHAGFGAARQRRHARRAIVQISPPARHLVGRRRGAERAGRAARRARGASPTRAPPPSSSIDGLEARQPEPLAVAALRPARGQQLAVADPRRGLLLQDLHVAGVVLGEGLRAADPPRRRPRPRVARRADPDRYEKAYASIATCWSIGAGPAGLMAALTAGARRRARRSWPSEDFRLGGRLLAERFEIDGSPARAGLRAARSRACGAARTCASCARTTVFGAIDSGIYGAVERVTDHLPVPPEHQPRQRLWRIVAKRAVLAAGAIERPMLFGGNDRPGVMLAGAVRTYLNRFAVAPGRRAVVFADNDDACAHRADLPPPAWRSRRSSIRGPSRARRDDRRRQGGRRALIAGGVVVRALGGRDGVQARRNRRDQRRATSASTAIWSRCRAAGIRPSTSPPISARKPRWNEQLTAFVPDQLPTGHARRRRGAGDFTLREALAEGARRGRAAAEPASTGSPATLPPVDAGVRRA